MRPAEGERYFGRAGAARVSDLRDGDRSSRLAETGFAGLRAAIRFPREQHK